MAKNLTSNEQVYRSGGRPVKVRNPESDDSEFVKHWLNWRRERGLTQEQAAKLVHCTRDAIARFEMYPSRSRPGGDAVDRMHEVISTHLSWRLSQLHELTPCPTCEMMTVSAKSGARHCMNCGSRL